MIWSKGTNSTVQETNVFQIHDFEVIIIYINNHNYSLVQVYLKRHNQHNILAEQHLLQINHIQFQKLV